MEKVTTQEITIYKEKPIVLFRITNSSNAYIEMLNYGATIVSVVVPDKEGRLDNIVLHYDNPTDYFSDKFYLGSTIGRVANRISKAEFMLNGNSYHLDKNDGKNSNHGGYNGFNKKIFDYRIKENSILLYTQSNDREGGFPGNLNFSVEYSFSDNNELQIIYTAWSDKATPVNFTNHSYFNLSGKRNTILNNQLKVNSQEYLESNNEFLPTGKIYPVKDTAFDFGEYKEIAKMLPLKNDSLKGYNAFFIKESKHNENTPLASLLDPDSGRTIDLYTSMPGVLIYTGDFLSDGFQPFEGICLEAQYHPDALNQPHFPSNILQPDQIKTDTLTYRFGCK
ncbi:aldose 1-epimerase [Dysgonomonas alginatilytica]|uniref:Aldose 1-epimerase n=1 Tax=Dysgonomonas alginatilytica TaxID=1605892 RepID=A0A2V3PRL8_9BACT|nr:aldose epimerase family protein [Dysgonomonas alginatilytica]PXV65023.1 aldose 1-epimerase [Dysgonomonas alginatilytica]